MKVGIFLTCQYPPGSDMVAALEAQYVMTRLARDQGWDAVGTGQHYLSEGFSQPQLVPFLARLAAEAGHMTGIAGVLLAALHNPVELAECVASLDMIWRGNFVFGIGLGYRDVEFDAFGVPKGARVRRYEQCIETVKRLWSGQPVSFENEVCKLANVTATARPVQRPHPPIWVAANSDAAVKRAARLGDTALELAGPYLAEKYQTYAAWGQDAVLPGNESFRQSLDALRRDRFVLGSPEECWEQLRPCWEEVGANFLILRTHWSGMPLGHALASMRLIGEELVPALHRLQPPATDAGGRAQVTPDPPADP